jgi:hypothetical protein
MVVMLLIFLPKMLMQRKYSRLSKSEQKKMMVLAICVKKNQRFLEDDFASAISFSLPAPLSLQFKGTGGNGASGSINVSSSRPSYKYQQARRISGLHLSSGKDIVTSINKNNRFNSSSKRIDGVSGCSGSGTSSSKNVRFAPLSRASRSSDDSSIVCAGGTGSSTTATAKMPRVSTDLDESEANDFCEKTNDHHDDDFDVYCENDDDDPARSTSTIRSFSSTGAAIIPYCVCSSSDHGISCLDVNNEDDKSVDPTLLFKKVLNLNRKNNVNDARVKVSIEATHEQDQTMTSSPPSSPSRLLLSHFISQVDRDTLKTDRERAVYDSLLSVAMA